MPNEEKEAKNEDLENLLKKRTLGEYQLCPKCNGDGHLGRYNSPVFSSTNSLPTCDVCNGSKIIAKPFL